MFEKILIANRGEIACRIAKTAQKMGIYTVAVFSEADRQASHVQACDEAICIGGTELKDSYLNIQAIIDAAQQSGAQAIHPGYGFLSENTHFVAACESAGLVFIGPSQQAMVAMGSKSAAKELMQKAGVPLVPGYHGTNQNADFLLEQADAINYPVLIKASLGGGGKGMRIVQQHEEFKAALDSCKREASHSFGDDQVLIERYVTKPRHIEIQIFGDNHGNYVYLFERDCSVQRRHQKVIEEAPAPGMTPARRQAMGQAAVSAAQAIAYSGAGTVEFIVEPSGHFYFMEMNTRLQVEHPVTEMITGYDLVEWQLLVAANQTLPIKQEDLHINGHAFEARIYAENPEQGFLPSIGQIEYLSTPKHESFTNGTIRIDSGVQQGDTISPFYDPMLAKLIVHGATREQALARMRQALAQMQIVGLHTNVGFLSRLFALPAFITADLDTSLIEKNQLALLPAETAIAPFDLAFATVATLAKQGFLNNRLTLSDSPSNPWDSAIYWRLNDAAFNHLFTFTRGETPYTVELTQREGNWRLVTQGHVYEISWHTLMEDASSPSTHVYQIDLRLNSLQKVANVVVYGQQTHIFTADSHCSLSSSDDLFVADDANGVAANNLNAPMPGKIIQLAVKAGDKVQAGSLLVIMEAMKMEHSITASQTGTVEEIFFDVGDQVTANAELIKINYYTE